MTKSWGMIALCLWLIFMGLVQALALQFNYMGLILGLMAIVSGVLLLVGK